MAPFLPESTEYPHANTHSHNPRNSITDLRRHSFDVITPLVPSHQHVFIIPNSHIDQMHNTTCNQCGIRYYQHVSGTIQDRANSLKEITTPIGHIHIWRQEVVTASAIQYTCVADNFSPYAKADSCCLDRCFEKLLHQNT
jgi:hypothetical protein